MKRTIGLLALTLCALFTPSVAQAQTRADTAAVLLKAAQDLRVDGRHEAARAVLELIRRRYDDTPSAAPVAALLSAYATSAQPDGSGRVEMLVWGTAYGMWLGVATPVMLKADDAAAFGVGLLAGAPAGFLAARKYVNSNPDISDGQARAITFGGSWGTWQGFGWMQALGGETVDCGEPYCSYEKEPSAEAVVTSMVAGGLLGIGTGMVLARKPIPSGVAAAVSASGLWGTWFGVAGGALGDLEDDDLLVAALLGGNATVAATALLAPKWNPSVNRVRLVSLSGLVGGVAGGGIVMIMQPDNEKVIIAIPLATSILGLAIGSNRTRDYDRLRAAPQPGGGEALLRYNDGNWNVGAVTPTPILRRDDRGARPRMQPAVAVNLFSARF